MYQARVETLGPSHQRAANYTGYFCFCCGQDSLVLIVSGLNLFAMYFSQAFYLSSTRLTIGRKAQEIPLVYSQHLLKTPAILFRHQIRIINSE